MQKHQIAEMHLGGTTGYGYNDSGREAVEALYADVFGTEDALVRPQITCGTHALGLALSANYVREMRFLQFQENHMIP